MRISFNSSVSLSLLALILVAALSLPALSQQEEVPPAEQPPAVDPQAEAFNNLMQASDPQQQLALAEQFIQDYPGSPYLPRVYVAAASAHRMQNHFDQAIEYGERALALNPRDVVSLLLVADSLSEGTRKGDAAYDEKLDKAHAYSQQALEVLPELFASVPRRPDVPEEQYKMQEQYFEAQARATLGYIHLRRDAFAQAEEQLKMATELNQLQPSPADYERLGVAQAELKKYQEAQESFRRCSQIGGPAFATCERRLEIVNGMIQKQDTP